MVSFTLRPPHQWRKESPVHTVKEVGLTQSQFGGKWLASRSGRLTSGEKSHRYTLLKKLDCLKASLEVLNRKSPS
jgi:hypothetical protein